jgi:hypothetical protein
MTCALVVCDASARLVAFRSDVASESWRSTVAGKNRAASNRKRGSFATQTYGPPRRVLQNLGANWQAFFGWMGGRMLARDPLERELFDITRVFLAAE